ncbi:MAG: Carboxy-terminal domain (CTD) phosphatase [Stictis urceolatum]|nr:Carboxy-terminal domain (CTD) phosphatase [Stictis urceolata]
MRLTLPRGLHYPITVTELLKKASDHVDRFDPLFAYTYKSIVVEGNRQGEEFNVERTYPSRFESSVEGELKSWMLKEGSVITKAGYVISLHGDVGLGNQVLTRNSHDIAEIEEPCAHSVQFAGMCVTCGKDMTEYELHAATLVALTADIAPYRQSYVTTQSNTVRANVNMIHDNVQLKVSEDEALRVEGEAKRRLLAAKKLSLVVDLDQTIIHATVDPTVAEWQKDPENPNYDAVKDVRSFQLTDEGPGGKGTWYYIKLRPGLEEFLENISKIYELHIYTMGTRAYAQNIAKLVDPDRKIFGDRILSRDESGSMVAKNLQRLFPVDTKMVVIIDDRGDVWNWNANLVKVTPFSFFVGIGDINSSFLPKRSKTRAAPKEVDGANAKPDDPASASKDNADAKPVATTNGDASEPDSKPTEHTVSALEQLVSMGGGDNPETLKEQNESQDKILAAQLEERPLLQKQKQLEESDATSTNNSENSHPRHHLLSNDDNELVFLEQSLRRVHDEFFENYKSQIADNTGGRLSQLRGAQSSRPKLTANSDLELIPDIKSVMPTVKARVLAGTNIVFSGVIPLDTELFSSEIVVWARSFGARIQTRVRGRTTTHVVAARNRTAKVRQAVSRGKGRIKVVSLNWLMACIVQWAHVDESPYLLKTGDEDLGRPFPGESEEENLSESESVSSEGDKSTDADGTESELDSRRPPNRNLRVRTARGADGGNTDDEAEMAALAPPAMDDPESPVGGTKQEWDQMHAELDDFLGDSADDDSDADSVASDLSIRAKKRKFDDGVSEGEGDGTKSPHKKRIRSGGSGLKEQLSDSNGGLPTPAVTAADGEGEGINGTGGDGDEDESNGWSDLEKDFDLEEDSNGDGDSAEVDYPSRW